MDAVGDRRSRELGADGARGQASHLWSVRAAAAETGICKTGVQRYFQLFGLQPHRSEGFKLSNDSFFIEKLRDVVGLYPNEERYHRELPELRNGGNTTALTTASVVRRKRRPPPWTSLSASNTKIQTAPAGIWRSQEVSVICYIQSLNARQPNLKIGLWHSTYTALAFVYYIADRVAPVLGPFRPPP